jgi:hypothetical protein
MPDEDAKVLDKLLKAVRRELKRHRRQMEVEFEALADASASSKTLNTAIARSITINERANAHLARLSSELAKHSRKLSSRSKDVTHFLASDEIPKAANRAAGRSGGPFSAYC